jgi:hypothetical protein
MKKMKISRIDKLQYILRFGSIKHTTKNNKDCWEFSAYKPSGDPIGTYYGIRVLIDIVFIAYT